MIRYGEWLLEHNQLHKLGNDVWAFLEQLGLAAAELGKLDLAEVRMLGSLRKALPSASEGPLHGLVACAIVAGCDP